jgi:hypothetical protein
MNRQDTPQADVLRKATSEDVRHVLGDLEDVTVAEILSARPTFADLSDAAIWARGDGDLVAREGKELTGPALAVAEIITRQDEELQEDRD